MLETLQHILQSASRFALDEAFLAVLLGIIFFVTFHPDLSNKAVHAKFTWVLIGILVIFWLLYGKQLGNKNDEVHLFHRTIIIDAKAIFFKRLVLISAIIMLLHQRVFSYKVEGEFFVFFFGSILALFLASMTTHLLLLYVALEFVSICSYLLVLLNKEKKNAEAGIKYLLFGAASSAVMLYGMSWLYGITGSLNFGTVEFGTALAKSPLWVVQVVGFMTIGGLLFKLSAAPFHVWTPDVYEATPTPVVSFLSIAPKAVGILVLIRILGRFTVDLSPLLSVIIVLSLTVGNFSALWQTNVKRMLGYSTIAHAGFLLVGVMAFTKSGQEATYFYIATYLVITMGAFMVIDLIAKRTLSFDLNEMKGLGQTDVLLTIIVMIFMAALVGFPPTVGFTAKLLIFSSLWDSYQIKESLPMLLVLVFGLLNMAVSIFYYLKIPYYMVIQKKPTYISWIYVSFFNYLLPVLFAAIVLYIFFAPTSLMQFINGL